MKQLISQYFFIIILFIAMSCKSNKTTSNDDSNLDASLTIFMSQNYCGGAAPSEEIIESLRKPKLMPNKDLYLVKSGSQIASAIKVRTDEKSSLNINLSAGDYQLFFPEKITSKSSRPIYEKVCKQWKETPNGTFSISKEKTSQEITITKTCNGCNDPAL